MDTSEADSTLRTLNLFNALFSIVAAAAIILAGLFPGLTVMQSAKEAAIMRVLGTTKKRARAMLSLEQGALCLFGLLLAAAVLLIINGSSVMEYSGKIGALAALQFASCVTGAVICAVIITKRRVLELLQVKE